MDRPDTPHLCIQKGTPREKQKLSGLPSREHSGEAASSEETVNAHNVHINSKSNEIWRDKTMKTPNKLATSTAQMRDRRIRPTESICCKS